MKECRDDLYGARHEESENEKRYLRELLYDFMKYCDKGGWIITEYTDRIIEEYVNSKQ